MVEGSLLQDYFYEKGSPEGYVRDVNDDITRFLAKHAGDEVEVQVMLSDLHDLIIDLQ